MTAATSIIVLSIVCIVLLVADLVCILLGQDKWRR